MNLRDEFQKWSSSHIRRISLCGVTSVLVIGADCLPAHAAGWISLPGIRKPKEKEPVAEKPAPDQSEHIFRAMNEAKAEEKKGNIDRAIMLAERAKRLAESNVSEEEPGSKVLVAASTTYFNELKSRKTELATKKAAKADEPKVASRPKMTEAKTAAKSGTDDKPKQTKQEIARQTPKTLRSGKVDERATITKAMKSEMTPSEKRPAESKSDISKSSALAEALETPKEPLKPTRRYQKVSTIPVTPKLSSVAEKPNGAEEQPVAQIAKSTVTETKVTPSVSEPEVEPDFDPFPNDHAKQPPAQKVVTRKQFAELWDAQGDTEENTKTAEPSWTAEIEPKRNDLFDLAEKQDTAMSRADEPVEGKELVDARRSMRIKLRPRHSNQEPQTPANTTEVADFTHVKEKSPEIHPMLRTSDADGNERALSRSENSNQVKIRSEAALPETLADVAQNPEKESTAVAANVPNELDSWGDDEASNNDFPSRNVLDLKRRLESCASLQPGEIATSQVSKPLTEFFVTDDEETTNELVAESTEPRTELTSDDAWDDSFDTATTSLSEAEPRDTQEEPQEISSKRVVKAEVTARMSLIRWRAASDGPAGSINSFEQKEKDHPDIRASLPIDVQSDKRSLFSLPSINVSLNENARQSDQKSVSNPSETRTVLTGSTWDNAAVPNDLLPPTASTNKKPVHNGSLNSEIAPPAPVEQVSFDGRHHRGDAGSGSGELVRASVIEIPDLHLPSVANVSYSNESHSEDASLHSDQAFDDGANTVVLNGPIERFAFVCGISTPAAAACLGALAMAMVVAGFFALRSAIRVALLARSED